MKHFYGNFSTGRTLFSKEDAGKAAMAEATHLFESDVESFDGFDLRCGAFLIGRKWTEGVYVRVCVCV